MPRIRALCFDLDDTLLINDMETFGIHYFRALVAKVQPVCPVPVFRAALEAAMHAMWHNDGRNGTNAEVFEQQFFPRIGRTPAELMPLFEDFYARDFEALRPYTAVDPAARELVTLAFARNYQVAIATQPMFPIAAIRARLRWAEVGAEEFPYDVITSYETMRACKPHPVYFQTLAERLGRAPAECLMVGDSLDSDIAASQVGFRTFWVVRGTPPSTTPRDLAHGSLRDLIARIETGGIDEL